MNMTIEYKIETIREVLKGIRTNSKDEKRVFYSILNVLQDMSDEIDDLNESLLL